LSFTITAIAHDPEFREVQDWVVAPSSSTQPNQIMVELKEDVRYMMYGRKREPIFLRHTNTRKSRFDGEQRSLPDYCQKHFGTICVNEAYRDKLKGRVVCVFDDYLTRGNTFETLRNLLVACEAKKIIFVSIGKFIRRGENSYVQKNFTINGDVHTPHYMATFLSPVYHAFVLDPAAQRSLCNLRELACYLQ